MPASAQPPKFAPEQMSLDFFLPGRSELLPPARVAEYTGWSVDFIYTMVDEGKLESFAVQERKFARMQITRRSVLLLLAEMARFSDLDLIERLAEIAGRLPKDQYALFLQLAANRRAKI